MPSQQDLSPRSCSGGSWARRCRPAMVSASPWWHPCMTSSSRPASLRPLQKANVSSVREEGGGPTGRALSGLLTTQRSKELTGGHLHLHTQQLQVVGWAAPHPGAPLHCHFGHEAPSLPSLPEGEGRWECLPPIAVVQSPGSSQVSMVMVAGDPFTATNTPHEPPHKLPQWPPGYELQSSLRTSFHKIDTHTRAKDSLALHFKFAFKPFNPIFKCVQRRKN